MDLPPFRGKYSVPTLNEPKKVGKNPLSSLQKNRRIHPDREKNRQTVVGIFNKRQAERPMEIIGNACIRPEFSGKRAKKVASALGFRSGTPWKPQNLYKTNKNIQYPKN